MSILQYCNEDPKRHNWKCFFCFIILLYSRLKYLIHGIWVHALFVRITLNGKIVAGMKDRLKLSSKEPHDKRTSETCHYLMEHVLMQVCT
jgi:hypothetical protein